MNYTRISGTTVHTAKRDYLLFAKHGLTPAFLIPNTSDSEKNRGVPLYQQEIVNKLNSKMDGNTRSISQDGGSNV